MDGSFHVRHSSVLYYYVFGGGYEFHLFKFIDANVDKARSCRIGDMTVPEGGFATEWTPMEPSKRQFAEGRGRL
jgi:hypothetical protein